MLCKTLKFNLIFIFFLGVFSLYAIAPRSEFYPEDVFLPDLRERVEINKGIYNFSDHQGYTDDFRVLIYLLKRDSEGQIISKEEVYNNFNDSNDGFVEDSLKQELNLQKEGEVFLLNDNEEYEIFISGVKKSAFNIQWGSLFLQKHYIYPSDSRLTELLINNFGQDAVFMSSLDFSEKCYLFDCFRETISEDSIEQRKFIESYYLLKKRGGILRKSNPAHLPRGEKAELLSEFSYCQQLGDVFTENDRLSNTFSVKFSEKFQYIDINSLNYLNFRQEIVDLLAYTISTYGGSLHKQVREQFIDYFGLGYNHFLNMNLKRNAREIDQLLGIGTKEGNARFSNNMIRNTEANAWHEAMTYLIKEAAYPWAKKNNLQLKEIFPECSAISVFDAEVQRRYKTVSFPFASVSEVLAYWVQVNTTHPEKLPDFITDNKLWVNHWKFNDDRARLLKLHRTFIEKTAPEFFPLDNPDLSRKFKDYDDFLSLANYDDILLLLRTYIHEYLPKFKNQYELMTKVAAELNMDPYQVMLADILFLDVGLKNDKQGMPNFIPPSLLFILNSTSAADNSDLANYAEAASFIRKMQIDSDIIVPFHSDGTPFATELIKENPRIKELETTALMFLTCLNSKSITNEVKEQLIEKFVKLNNAADLPYQDSSYLLRDIEAFKEFSYIPKSFNHFFPDIIGSNQRLKALTDVINFARVYGLEEKLYQVLSYINDVEIFDQLFLNDMVIFKILKMPLSTMFYRNDKGSSRKVIDDSYKEASFVNPLRLRPFNEEVLIQETASITDLNSNSFSFILKEARNIIIKHLSLDIQDYFNSRKLEIGFFRQPKMNVLQSYAADYKQSLFFIDKDKNDSVVLYIDENFFDYIRRDNATRSNLIAGMLAYALAFCDIEGEEDLDVLRDAAYNNQFSIMPGNVFYQAEKSFMFSLSGAEHLAEKNDFVQNKEIRLNLSFLIKIRDSLRKFLDTKSEKSYEDILRRLQYIRGNLFDAYKNHGENLDIKQSVLSSFISAGQINMFERSLKMIKENKDSDFHQNQVRNFLFSLKKTETLMKTADKLRVRIMAEFGSKVELSSVVQHKNKSRFKVIIHDKGIALEDVLPVINTINKDGEFEFQGFSEGLPIWKNIRGSKYSEYEVLIDIKDISKELIQRITRQLNSQGKAVSEIFNSLLSDSGYFLDDSEEIRKQKLYEGIESCKTPAEIIQEVFLFTIFKTTNEGQLDNSLFDIVEQSISILSDIYSFSSRKKIIKYALKSLKKMSEEKLTGKKASLMSMFKDPAGQGLINLFRKFKKAELHRHISGSIAPAYLLEEFWFDKDNRRLFIRDNFPGEFKKLEEQAGSDEDMEKAVNIMFAEKIGGPKTTAYVRELQSVINEKHKKIDVLISAILEGNDSTAAKTRNSIAVLEERIKELMGGDKAIDNIKEFVEYRPLEKAGVSILPYLQKLEPAKIPLKSKESLKVMRRYARESVLGDYIFDNIQLSELRTSGVREGSSYTQEEAVESYIKGLIDAEVLSNNNLSSGYILCLYKDLQANLSGADKKLLAADLNNLKGKSVQQVRSWLFKNIKKEIENDYDDPELVKKILIEEKNNIRNMIADSRLQLSYGRIEDFDRVYNEQYFRLKKQDVISEDEMEESLKIKMIYFMHSRTIFLRQVKDLLATKEKWSNDPLKKKYADKIKGIDAVWSELDEIVWPSLAAFRYAKHHGLATTYHVGESWNSGEFKSALLRMKRVLDADYIDRLGHATALGVYINNLGDNYSGNERNALKKIQRGLLRHKNINKAVIESCETSNVLLTEDLPGYAQHVAGFFMQKMLNVVLAQDNSAVLHTNGLSGELTRLWLVNPNVSFSDILLLIANSYKNSFLQDDKLVRKISNITKTYEKELKIKSSKDFLSEVDRVILFGEINLQIEAGNIKAINIKGDGQVSLPFDISPHDIKAVIHYADENSEDALIVVAKNKILFYDSMYQQWVVRSNNQNVIDLTDVKFLDISA